MIGPNLSEWALGRRSLIIFLMVVAVAAGSLSFLGLGRAEDPAITFRTMVVAAGWPGATVDETLLQVTERLERKRRREERIEAHRLEVERREAEERDAERLEAERRAGEQQAAVPAEAERLELERLQAEIDELERAEKRARTEHDELG